MLVPTQGHGKTPKALQTHCQNGHPFDELNTYISPKSKKRCCRICQSNRNRRVFEMDVEGNRLKNRLHMQQWRNANRERHNKNYNERRRIKKEWLDAQKVKCCLCPETDPVCLDFHHKDPSQKDANLSVVVAHWSTKRLKTEMAKCVIICSNCHRKLHAQERSS